MTDPALQSEIRTLRQSGMSYCAIMRLLKRNFLPGQQTEVTPSITAVRKICGEPARAYRSQQSSEESS